MRRNILGALGVTVVGLCLFVVSADGARAGEKPVQADNLLPNPSFEKQKDGMPLGWFLSGGAEGYVEKEGRESARCISIIGKLDRQEWWYTQLEDLLKKGETYRFSFYAKQSPGTRGGSVISGPSFCNRDFHPTEEWKRYSFVFVATERIEGSIIRLGYREREGKTFFDDVSLVLVEPVHLTKHGITLGKFEKIEGNIYTFAPGFWYDGSNYSRPLFRANCFFNTTRWVFEPGSYVIYKHEIKGVKQMDAKVAVSVGYYDAGDCLIEASTDGKNWELIGKLSRIDVEEFILPHKFFPASKVYIRLRSLKEDEGTESLQPGRFQVTRYRYISTLDRNLPIFIGNTEFLEMERHSKKLKELMSKLKKTKIRTAKQKHWKETIAQELSSLEKKIKNGLLKEKEIDNSFDFFSRLIIALEGDKLKFEDFLVYVVKPITNRRILPDTINVRGEISDELKIVAALGEYEPASFVIKAVVKDLKDLELEVSELKGDKGKTIHPSAIDIRVVKCWYQDEGIGIGRGSQEETPAGDYDPSGYSGIKVLVPELLLRDDSLIKVDTEVKHNYVKITDEKGEIKYVIESSEKRGEGFSGASAVPIEDSPYLLPVEIKKGANKQFWLTVKVPEDALPDIYKTEIKIRTKKEILGKLTLKLRVLPFKLSEPYYISSIYYRGPCRRFYGEKWLEQLKREMENLYAHGVTNPIIAYVFPKELPEILRIRKEVGMDNKTIFYLWPIDYERLTDNSPETLEYFKKLTKEIIEITKPYGVEELYLYGIDEAKRERLAAQRPAWEVIRQAGAKIFVSGYQPRHHPPGNFALVGDIQDLIVCAYYPCREEAAKWHSKGHKILCYANPQGGAELPETYRRNFGILLWQYNYDGAMTWPYYWCGGGWGWGDFVVPGGKWKQHNMVYPIKNGVIDTIQWEGYREGVDDVRYLTTLLKKIEKAEKSKDGKIRKVASEAKVYLDRLKNDDINRSKADLDVIRSEMIDYILKLVELGVK